MSLQLSREATRVLYFKPCRAGRPGGSHKPTRASRCGARPTLKGALAVAASGASSEAKAIKCTTSGIGTTAVIAKANQKVGRGDEADIEQPQQHQSRKELRAE